MDGKRFDVLAKTLAPRATRREGIKAAVGAALAALLGGVATDGTVAAKKCRGGRKKCGDKCCRPGQICKRGRCKAAPSSPSTPSTTCDGAQVACPSQGFFLTGCKGNGTCYCGKSVNGASFCGQDEGFQTICNSRTVCGADSDCPANWKCAPTCCGGPNQAAYRCLRPCGAF